MKACNSRNLMAQQGFRKLRIEGFNVSTFNRLCTRHNCCRWQSCISKSAKVDRITQKKLIRYGKPKERRGGGSSSDDDDDDDDSDSDDDDDSDSVIQRTKQHASPDSCTLGLGTLVLGLALSKMNPHYLIRNRS